MRPIPLTVLKGGINRLRIKGGAPPVFLYDLTNAYLSQAGTVVPREGTIRLATLNANTVGLAAINGVFHVFSTSLQAVPAGFVCDVLVHPTNAAATLVKIWFAKPFMGFIYVAAEFNTGDIFHYWLQNNGTWTANTVYTAGNIVLPPTATGFAYKAVRDMPPNSTWQPSVTVAANTIVEPVEATGYCYKAIAAAGTSPHTGTIEPTWPTTAGATLQEFGDFDLNSNDIGTTGASTAPGPQPLGTNITDRYGDSPAPTTISTWGAGLTYSAGAVVQPSTSQGAYVDAIPNGDFEAGNDGNWTMDPGWSIVNDAYAYQGNYSAEFVHTGAGFFDIRMTNYSTVTPGQSVTATMYAHGDTDGAIYAMLSWYDATGTHLSDTLGTHEGADGVNTLNYTKLTVSGPAPANAVQCRAGAQFQTGSSSARSGRLDLISWNLEQPTAVSNFLYEAVQSGPAASGSTEPVWPTTAGDTIIDGGVTWKAIGTSIITWQAIPLMQSGATAPAFTTAVGTSANDPSTYTDKNGVVINTSMSWECIARQISDSNCPNSKAVCIGASHIFAGDVDITSYSAAVDPTDWTSANNAGYLPTGLNTYGDNPVTVLALYRSNLMVFNAGGYQMWQIDPDPANMFFFYDYAIC